MELLLFISYTHGVISYPHASVKFPVACVLQGGTRRGCMDARSDNSSAGSEKRHRRQASAISLTKAQGVVSGIKQYAVRTRAMMLRYSPNQTLPHPSRLFPVCPAVLQASHAALEQSESYSKQLTGIFRAPDTIKAQHIFCDDIRRRVQHASVNLRRQTAARSSADVLPPDGGSGKVPPELTAKLITQNEMQTDDRSLAAWASPVGCTEAMLQNAPTQTSGEQTVSEKQRAQLEERIFEQERARLSEVYRADHERIVAAHSAALHAAKAGSDAELSQLTSAQAREICTLEERVMRACALEDVELPSQLMKHRFKPSARLSELKRQVAGGMSTLPLEKSSGLDTPKSKAKLAEEEAKLESEEVCHSPANHIIINPAS